MERFWKIRRERLQLMADILEVEELEVVVHGLEMMRSADKKIQNSSASIQSAG